MCCCNQASTGNTRAPNAGGGLTLGPQQNRLSQSLAALAAGPKATQGEEEEKEHNETLDKETLDEVSGIPF